MCDVYKDARAAIDDADREIRARLALDVLDWTLLTQKEINEAMAIVGSKIERDVIV
jgi:hypothetical protein